MFGKRCSMFGVSSGLIVFGLGQNAVFGHWTDLQASVVVVVFCSTLVMFCCCFVRLVFCSVFCSENKKQFGFVWCSCSANSCVVRVRQAAVLFVFVFREHKIAKCFVRVRVRATAVLFKRVYWHNGCSVFGSSVPCFFSSSFSLFSSASFLLSFSISPAGSHDKAPARA